MKLYFYKCAGEEYSTGHVYFDHSNGIAGYEKVQQRANYLGNYTVEEFEKKQRMQASRTSGTTANGRRRGYVNTSRRYDGRY